MNYVDIIGIGMGPRDLTQFHMKLVEESDLLIGGARQLSMFPKYTGDTFQITRDIPGLIDKIKTEAATRKIVILASGDPLFYGIGSTLSRHFSTQQIRIHPNISSIAAAFAKIGLPWQDAKVVSLHNSQPENDLASLLRGHKKIGFLTSPERGPGFIADKVKNSWATGSRLCVIENIGDPETEVLTWFSDLRDVSKHGFSDPNIVILVQASQPLDRQDDFADVPHETHLGMPEHYFSHSKGLITKSEIRSLTLSKLKITRSNLVLWDIGAGSGSVGLEAALLLPKGMVYSIEKNPDRIKDIQLNIRKFRLFNVAVHKMDFPEERCNLRKPDRIFIGGGGGDLDAIIRTAEKHLVSKGVLVINTVIAVNMTTAMATLADLGMSPETIQVQINRSDPIANGHRFNPLNPVWIVSGRKPM